jgi:hypothetical protein
VLEQYSYGTFVAAIDVERVEHVSLQGCNDVFKGGNEKLDVLLDDE